MIPFPILNKQRKVVESKITQIAGGDGYALALTDDGNLYAIGSSSSGAMGLGNVSSVSTWTKVRGDVTGLWGGINCTFITGVDGKIYACGNLAHIGISTITTFTSHANFNAMAAPTRKVKRIVSYTKNVLVLMEDKTLWVAGSAYLANGSFTNNVRPTFASVATDAMNVSLSDSVLYYIRTDGWLFGCGDTWALNQAYTDPNRTSWTSQAPNCSTTVPMGIVYRATIWANVNNIPTCVGLSSAGQLGNSNISEAQGNRVYPYTSYLNSASTVISEVKHFDSEPFKTIIAGSTGFFYSGKFKSYTNGTNGSSTQATYTAVTSFVTNYSSALVQAIHLAPSTSYILYNNKLYVSGTWVDGSVKTKFTAIPSPSA